MKCLYILIDCLYYINVPIQQRTGYVETGRSLLRGHDVLRIPHVARDLLHVISQNVITHGTAFETLIGGRGWMRC